jgi:alpha-ketoglutarate-dependent taurine dioxygenase
MTSCWPSARIWRRGSSSPSRSTYETKTHLIDLYEEIASRPDLRLDMALRPGDIQWLSNHTILHARSAYRDAADPDERRHLLRLWLSIGA